MSIEIPLFPLDSLLFPHMPMRLHMFEERHRAMLRDCGELGTSFGMVGIRKGIEAGGGGPAPYGVGTLARIRSLDTLDDGGYDLIVSGASRFRIGAVTVGARPYLVGNVAYLEDVSGDPVALDRLTPTVAEAFLGYSRRLGELRDEPATDLQLPDDPELLSYLVASSLHVETGHKQELLEVDSAEARLRLCLRLLRREEVLLDHSLARPERPIATVTPN